MPFDFPILNDAKTPKNIEKTIWIFIFKKSVRKGLKAHFAQLGELFLKRRAHYISLAYTYSFYATYPLFPKAASYCLW